jgi:tyrosine-protein phosphatase SIW14
MPDSSEPAPHAETATAPPSAWRRAWAGLHGAAFGYPRAKPTPPDSVTALELPGLPNCYQVTPNLLRGAQPSAEGMRNLETLGIRTVVNLRMFHSDRTKLRGTNLEYEGIFFNPLRPKVKKVVRFLRIVGDPARSPVFVHCNHGADRTGTMVALYRIVFEGWTKEDALKEMREKSFGFHEHFFPNLLTFVEQVDLAALHLELQDLLNSSPPEGAGC